MRVTSHGVSDPEDTEIQNSSKVRLSISVVICSYGGNESLARSCILSLLKQTYPPTEILIIVDTEEEREYFQRYFQDIGGDLHFHATGKKGLAAARNQGIERSRGEIIAFVDDDAIADPAWLQHIATAFSSDPNIAIAGGPVRPVFEGNAIEEGLYWIVGCTSDDPPTTRPIGCNFAIRREILKSVGGFNEELGRIRNKLAVGEETELILRTRQKMPGRKIVFIPAALVHHHVPIRRTKITYMLKRAFEEGSSKAYIGRAYALKEEKGRILHYLSRPSAMRLLMTAATLVGYLNGWVSCRPFISGDR